MRRARGSATGLPRDVAASRPPKARQDTHDPSPPLAGFCDCASLRRLQAMGHRRIQGFAFAVLASLLPGQADPDNQVAPDRRSGTVVLRFDAQLRCTYGFTTADFGLA